jgi:hypothetical protein
MLCCDAHAFLTMFLFVDTRAAEADGGSSDDDTEDPIDALVRRRLKQLEKEKRKRDADAASKLKRSGTTSSGSRLGGSKRKPEDGDRASQAFTLFSVHSLHMGDSDDESVDSRSGAKKSAVQKSNPRDEEKLFVADDGSASVATSTVSLGAVALPVLQDAPKVEAMAISSVLSAFKPAEGDAAPKRGLGVLLKRGAPKPDDAVDQKPADEEKQVSSKPASVISTKASGLLSKYKFDKPSIVDVPPDYPRRGKPSVPEDVKRQRALEAAKAAARREEEQEAAAQRKAAAVQAKLQAKARKEEFFAELARFCTVHVMVARNCGV